jgi:hypothetical protein
MELQRTPPASWAAFDGGQRVYRDTSPTFTHVPCIGKIIQSDPEAQCIDLDLEEVLSQPEMGSSHNSCHGAALGAP